MTKCLNFALAALVFISQFAAVIPPAQGAEVPAGAKPTGAIAGRITDESGQPIPGAGAEAYRCVDDAMSGSAVADKKGEYLLQGLADGCYRVRFGGEHFESTWHGGAGVREDSAEILVGGEKVQGIDGELSEAGSVITGTVKSSGGSPLAGAWVTVLNGGSAQGETGSISDGRTDEKGAFSVHISPGSCLVAFSRKGYVTKLHGPSPLEPGVVEAEKGKVVTGIDAVLSPGGRITGSVSDETAKPLQGVYAIAYSAEATVLPVAARSDAAGNFVLDGLGSGRYRIAFGDRERKYVMQWYPGTTNAAEATVITVAAPGVVSGIKGVIRQSGAISGMVTDQGGKAIPRVMVAAEPMDRNGPGGTAITDETGAYKIVGLDSAAYRVSFRAYGGAYLPSFYRDAPSKEAAQAVEVAAPQMVVGINQVLQDGVMLSGKVTDSSGEPVEAMVTVHPLKEGSADPAFAICQADGTFSVAAADGEYVLEVQAQGYLPQWSGNRSSRSDAVPVKISKKEGGLSLEVVLQRGGSISGTVKDGIGTGLSGVTVRARDAATGDRAESATSEEGGKYQIQGLDSGAYRLSADGSDAGYVEVKLPQPVMVTSPASTENVDFVLTRGGAVAGKVTDPAGNPLPMVNVSAHDPGTWDEVGSAYTSESGEYKIGGLPEGSYLVRFEKSDSQYPVQWYKGKFRRQESTQLEISGTATVAGVDAALSSGVPLSGKVTSTEGAALANAKVEVYGGSEDEPFAEVRTDSRGGFTVPSLAPGSYRVLFSHKDHVSRWHGGRDRRNATPLTIKETGVAPLSAALTPARGTSSGKLMDPEGKKIGQAWLTAIDAMTGVAVADERICECSGEFHTPVPAGVYRLRVERHGQVAWYGGNSQEEAHQLPGSGEISGLEMVIEDKYVRGKQRQGK